MFDSQTAPGSEDRIPVTNRSQAKHYLDMNVGPGTGAYLDDHAGRHDIKTINLPYQGLYDRYRMCRFYLADDVERVAATLRTIAQREEAQAKAGMKEAWSTCRINEFDRSPEQPTVTRGRKH